MQKIRSNKVGESSEIISTKFGVLCKYSCYYFFQANPNTKFHVYIYSPLAIVATK